MKLLSKISYYHFWLSVFVLGITGFMLFLFLRREVSKEIEEQLELQADMIAEEIRIGKTVNFPLVQISTGDEHLMKLPTVFKDTLIYDRLQKVTEGYYYLTQSKKINNQAYRIKVMTTYIGWSNYSRTIIYIFLCIAGMLIILGTLVNYMISSRIWNPFLINLRRMKAYSVSSKEELLLTSSDVKEFQEMNEVLNDLAQRGRKEYNALKEFTENASHEIQTPLSILKTRLESISQLPLDANIARLLSDAKKAVIRLSKVNKGLLLLAKLENNNFPDTKPLDLRTMLNAVIEQTEDLIKHRSIDLVKEIGHKKVIASPFLIESLISNLLSNLINHSAANTKAFIKLDYNMMEFSNEGSPLNFPESRLFTRFAKGTDGYNGNGLGLSIIKQICTVNKWQISYNYSEGMHVFRVVFLADTSGNV